MTATMPGWVFVVMVVLFLSAAWLLAELLAAPVTEDPDVELARLLAEGTVEHLGGGTYRVSREQLSPDEWATLDRLFGGEPEETDRHGD